MLLSDQKYSDKSLQALAKCSSEGRLIISEVVYAELLIPFLTGNADLNIDDFLKETDISISYTHKDGLLIAAKAWIEYFMKRKITQEIYCPSCNQANLVSCQHCGSLLKWRNHIITDFIVGGHALNSANRLLTRDRGIYEKYFKNLVIIDPSQLSF